MSFAKEKTKGYVMILLSALCFGSYGVWSRLLGSEFGIFYQGWVRALLVLMILLPVAILGKHLKRVKKKDAKWFAISMVFTIFTQAPLYYAFNHLPLATATFIFYGFFLLTSYLVSGIFLSEKINGIKQISFFLGLVGLFVTFGISWDHFALEAMLLAALSGIASGGEIATSKKSTKIYSSLQLTVYSWVLVFLTHLPLSLLTHEPQIPFAFSIEWLSMGGYALSGLGGFWLVIEGFKYVEASIGGLIGLIEILFSAAFGILFFHDHLTLSVILGGILIMIAAVLPDLYALKYPKTKSVPPPPPL